MATPRRVHLHTLADNRAGSETDLRLHPLPLESVITTQQLFIRESRAPDHEGESRALNSLMEVIAESPDIILQRLADTALELCRAHSAGISLVETADEDAILRWRATAGRWARFAGGTMPRGSSPCGTVLDRNASLLFSRPQYHFDIPKDLDPEIVEALLVPFRVLGKSVGTIWVISHDENRIFDAEDWRLLASLARFAANAYQILGGIAELQAANKAKADFLADLSYGVRTPLAAITGYVELLEVGVHGRVNEQQQSDIKRIRQNAEFLTALVDDVLSFARLEAGHLEISISEVDADQLLEAVGSVCEPYAKAHLIALSKRPTSCVMAVRADANRLKQILVNLILNALGRTSSGGEVALSYEIDESKMEGRISVADTGPAPTAEVIRHIFDPFLYKPQHSEGDPAPTGLGLAISRKLVREMDGDITVSSQPDSGCILVISLPLSTAVQARAG